MHSAISVVLGDTILRGVRRLVRCPRCQKLLCMTDDIASNIMDLFSQQSRSRHVSDKVDSKEELGRVGSEVSHRTKRETLDPHSPYSQPLHSS
jgi:hypothetical protein